MAGGGGSFCCCQYHVRETLRGRGVAADGKWSDGDDGRSGARNAVIFSIIDDVPLGKKLVLVVTVRMVEEGGVVLFEARQIV